MKKQTAVEWFIEQIESGKIEIVYSNKIHSIKCITEISNQALAMEKEQLEEAKSEGYEFATQEAIKEIHKNYKPI
jgi:hypothetical protein